MTDSSDMQITISAPRSLVRTIEEIARAEKRSRSAQVNILLEKALGIAGKQSRRPQSTTDPRESK